MKKSLLFLALVPFIFSACYEGPWGARQEYTVSGNVFFPDSVTPLIDAAVLVTDTTFWANWDGRSERRKKPGETVWILDQTFTQ